MAEWSMGARLESEAGEQHEATSKRANIHAISHLSLQNHHMMCVVDLDVLRGSELHLSQSYHNRLVHLGAISFNIPRVLVPEDTRHLPLLAAFALSGDTGAAATEVATAFGVSVLDVRNTLVSLAAGGVVEEVGRFGEHRVAVHPPALRGVLVRDAFYKGAQRLDPAPLIEQLRSDPARIAGLASSLLAAQQRGAAISNDLLLGLAMDADSDAVWHHIGFVNDSMSRDLLKCQPAHILRAADGLLQSDAEATLPHLLRIAALPGQSKSNPAQRSIKQWLEGDEPGDGVSIPRRRSLLDALRAISADPESRSSNAHDWAFALAIAPSIDAHRVPPGDSRKVIIYSGLPPVSQLREIRCCGRKFSQLVVANTSCPKNCVVS